MGGNHTPDRIYGFVLSHIDLWSAEAIGSIRPASYPAGPFHDDHWDDLRSELLLLCIEHLGKIISQYRTLENAELIKRCGLTVRKIIATNLRRVFFTKMARVGTGADFSLENPIYNAADGALLVPDAASVMEADEEQLFQRHELSSMVEMVRPHFTQKQYRVLRMKVVDGFNYHDICLAMVMSSESYYNIVSRINQVLARLKSEGTDWNLPLPLSFA